MFTVGAIVPEASIHENSDLSDRESDIWPARCLLPIHSIASDSFLPKSSSQR
jgi:hypothetical protein